MKIYFLLTEKCNLHCKMCVRGDKNNKEISFAELSSSNWVKELSEHDVVITGGEPTLCKDFSSIVQFLSTIAKNISICTNGINSGYISKDFFKPNIKVQISIDGTEVFHNQIRGEGTFQKTFETINKLEKLDIPYSISSVANKKNVSCMKELSNILSTLQCLEQWNISYEMPFGFSSFDDMMTTEEWNDFVDSMLDYVPFRLVIRKLFPFDLFEKFKDKLDEMFKGKKCSNCGSGTNKIYIYPDLTVYPCTCLTDFPLGNLTNHSLSEILQSTSALRFCNYKVLEKSVCMNCNYLKYCNGGCIGMSYNYFHVLGAGDIRCPKLRNQTQNIV